MAGLIKYALPNGVMQEVSAANPLPTSVTNTPSVNVANTPNVAVTNTPNVVLPNKTVAYTTTLSASLVAKASAGNLTGFYGRIDSTAPTADYYLLPIRAVSLPANGVVTLVTGGIKYKHTNGTDTPVQLWIPDNGVPFITGCVLALSSTGGATLTISGNYLDITAITT